MINQTHVPRLTLLCHAHTRLTACLCVCVCVCVCVCRWGVKRRGVTWKVIIKVESSPLPATLCAWFGGVRARVCCHGNFVLSDVLCRETLREIIPELNRICFESAEMSRARLCCPSRRSHAGNNGKASCLSVGQGCTSPEFHLQMNPRPWWKCSEARATMKRLHRECNL